MIEQPNFQHDLLALQSLNDAAVFFNGKQSNNYLSLLLHLSRYSNLLLTVTGAEGSGKTHLKNHFIQQLDSGVNLLSLNASQLTSVNQLAHALIEKLNLNDLSNINQLLDEVKDYCRNLNSEGGSLLVVIDDAHLLNNASLGLLLQLATLTEDNNRPHLALFGEELLLTALNQPDYKASYEKVAHQLPLEAFNQELSQAYLTHRCQSVGIETLPFSQAELAQMHLQAKGLPGLLNQALLAKYTQAAANARLSLTPDAPVQPSPAKKSANKPADNSAYKANPLPIWLILALALTLALFVLAYFYQEEFFNQQQAEESAEEEWQAPTQLKKLAEMEAALVQEAAQPEELALPVEEVEATVIPQEEVGGLDLPDDAPQSASKAPSTKKAEPTPAPVQPTKPKAVQPKWQDTGFKKEASLMAKNSKHYTLQMLGSHDKAQIEAFIKEQSFASKQLLSYFESRHKGKVWFVVVYGDYPNIEAARAAIPQLEASLAKQQPWARSFASVQDSIKSR